MAKQQTLTELKAKLDKIFSQYIRLRKADDLGNAKCVTCGTVNHWKKLQNGHFMSRRHLSTRWSEDNCQVQCYSCNVMQQGKQYEYAKWLDNTYGKGKADQLLLESKQLRKFDRFELERMIDQYKQEVKYHLNRINE